MSVAWYIGLSLNLLWSILWAYGSHQPFKTTEEVKHINHMTLVAWFNGIITLMLILGTATGGIQPWFRG